MELSLYHYWRSSCSWRVRWALALKGVAYESVPVNILAGEHGQEAHKARNPAGFLPALTVDGRSFGESVAMLEFIEETWAEPPLLPKDPLDRMLTRQLAMTIAAGTQPLQNLWLMKVVAPEEAARQKYAQMVIGKGLGVYEELLRTSGKMGTFSVGDQVTMADLCLIPQVYNAHRFQVDMKAFPRCAAIYERSLKTKECDAAAPHNQPGAQV